MIIRSGPTGGNFFAAVNSFAANIAISGNVVLTTKNSINAHPKKKCKKLFLLKSE